MHLFSRFPRSARSALLAVLVAFPVAVAPEAAAASGPGVRGARGMVVGPDAEANRVGAAVLADGGNAVDAAVASALACAVTYPLAGNLGGGGFLLYRAPGPDGPEYAALDFREAAPAALRAEHFLDDEGRPLADRTLRGGLAVGVPGTVAGLAEAHRRWGRLEWKRLVEPAVRLAEEGFAVPAFLAEAIALQRAKLAGDARAAEIFLPGGEPPAAGALLRQPALAATLRRVRDAGAAGFYDGPVAAAIAGAVREAGGVMRAEDLRAYRAALREPVVGSYRGHRVVSFPPPSSGGIALLQILGTVERYDLRARGPYASQAVHWLVEAERRAFADRSRWLGDPDFADVPAAALLDPAYLARRAATIEDDRATPSEDVEPGRPLPGAGGETMHLSIADPDGGAVAITLTLNAWFGNGQVAGPTGVLLNNEIDDFAVAPGVPNLYGLIGGEANAVEGGKRPLSSMTPTIVEAREPGPRPLLVLGTPGGSTIITSVAQVIVRVIDHGMTPQEAVDSPRFHHQWLPDRILHEPRAFPEDVADALRRRGHVLVESARPIGNVSAIGLDAEGRWIGAADPRRASSAAGL